MAYQEFKSNPWNFLSRKLKTTVEEKDIESNIQAGISDMNYRSILMYQNNGLQPCRDQMNYENLALVRGITTVFYLFDHDTYILDNPRDVEASCIHTITVINRVYSQSVTMQIDRSTYGMGGLYYLACRSFKLVYSEKDSSMYIEKMAAGPLWFFNCFGTWHGKASIRIYSTRPCLYANDKWTCDSPEPAITERFENCSRAYTEIIVPVRIVTTGDNAIDYLRKYLASDDITASKMLMTRPVYETGISISSMATIAETIGGLGLGTLTDKKYELEKRSYESRLFSYGFVAITKDTVIGLFFNSNSTVPFHHSTDNRESIFLFANHYCYFLGKTSSNFYYSFSEFTVSITESNTSGKSSVITIHDGEARYMGDWRITCRSPIMFSDTTASPCKCFFYRNIKPVLTLVELSN